MLKGVCKISTRVIILVMLMILRLNAGLAQIAPAKYSLLTADGWIPAAGRIIDERESFGYGIKETLNGLEFTVTGYPGSPRTVSWSKAVKDLNLSEYSHAIIEYTAEWLNNEGDMIVALTSPNSKGVSRDTAFLKVYDLIDDGRPHKLFIKNTLKGSCEKIMVRINTRSSKAYLSIRSLDFVKSENELTECLEYLAVADNSNPDLKRIDLNGKYNSSYTDVLKGFLEKNPVINEGGSYFRSNNVEILGIPFSVSPDGRNLLGFPPASKVNEEMVDHFGSQVRRGSVAPVSRDDKIAVEVNFQASELFFVLMAEHPQISPRSQLYRSFRIEDIETFAVELIYSDGTIDFAFPYSIKDASHIIQGTMGAYVVPASGKKLERVLFHNRTLNKEFFLAAVTVNSGQSRLFPQLAEEPGPKALQAPKVPDPAVTAPYLNYQNGILEAGNSYVNLRIDARRAFTITRFDNKWLGNSDITLSPTPGFEVTLGDRKEEAENIMLLNVSDVTGSAGKEITLTYGLRKAEVPLEFRIVVSVAEEPEVGMQMTIINKTKKDLNAKVVFPLMKGIQMGDYDDVWYYYPAYRNVFSNQSGSFDNIYSLSFPMQFYDVYNPILGGGFYLATRETDVEELRRYGFRKGENGMMCYLEYPKVHTMLKAGVPSALCKTVIGVHKGDWHAGLDVYKSWLQTWYKPMNAQDKEWYRQSFWLLCDYPDNIPSDASQIRRGFTWYDQSTRQYRMQDILDEHKRTVGRNPDILHLWSWTYNMPRPYTRWGAYGTNGEYESLGGLKNFRKAIDDIQKKAGIPVSLYFDASLCNPDLPIAKQLGSKGYMLKANGDPLTDYGRAYRMCPGSKPWREYMQAVYKRVNKELNVNILYVDEWAPPFYNGHLPISVFNCYSTEHEHGVPANMNHEVSKFMYDIRLTTPKTAALYGEYPDVDANTRYYDSNITYYLTDWGAGLKDSRDNYAYDLSKGQAGGMSDPYLQLYKFVFPGCVQLLLPNDAMYYSWNRLKFSFLNGDAIYDSFWLRDESKAEAFMVKSHDIKKKYADCFASDDTEVMMPAIQSGVFVNKYGGKGRSVWAVYNQRFTTVRGEILKIRHFEGATYYDAWNDKPLRARISGDYAYISLEMYPQAVECIIQSVNQ